MEFERKKAYFIGIDSDGTVFDSMTLKHTYAFIPAMIRVWGLAEFSDTVYRVAEDINLYSKTRGVNRFPGLLLTFDVLKQGLGESFPIKDYSDLKLFAESDAPMSGAGLKAYLSAHPSPFLEEVLRWSEMGDGLFLEACKTLPPFQGVKPALEKMRQECDCMVVSAASGQGLHEDWGRNGLLELVDFVAGQEFGGKDVQLAMAAGQGYDPEKCLMLGDGLGDLEAARKNGFCFYPILPAKEEQCWQQLLEVYYPMLLAGSYAGACEETLCQEFREFLEK